MRRVLLSLKRQWVEALLAVALGVLCWQVRSATAPTEPGGAEMVLKAEQGTASLALRNADFPQTFISSIRVDLTSPNHWVRVSWSGPQADGQETGLFRSSPGAGLGDNDCNDMAESNRGGSRCTPKGRHMVEGFGDFLPSIPACEFVTWIHSSREIALHSHSLVPDHPASSGCVRMEEPAAQLIHNNARAGVTEVIVDGMWTSPP